MGLNDPEARWCPVCRDADKSNYLGPHPQAPAGHLMCMCCSTTLTPAALAEAQAVQAAHSTESARHIRFRAQAEAYRRQWPQEVSYA